MPIGIITGSGTYALPGFDGSEPEVFPTPWGDALVSRGTFAGAEVLHVSRHGAGHPRLSNHVTHRANIAALQALGASGVLAVTVCGAVDPETTLASLVCFDDLHFLANRLPDGSLCTFFTEPGAPERGHWIYEGPFAADLRGALLEGAAAAGGAGGGGGGSRGARRRLLRPRRRPALQHARRDPLARRRGSDRGVPDRGAGDRPVRRGRAAVRAAGVPDRLCERRPGRGHAGRHAGRDDGRVDRRLRPRPRGGRRRPARAPPRRRRAPR